jgi:type II secretory pathway pseudopilin PulG
MVRRRSQGFTYLTVLFMIAILMGGLALVGEVWETSTKREKETELLFIGHQYRRAIGLYYDSGTPKRYPATLEDLIKDSRKGSTQRYLRKLYPDPITGKDWALVQAPGGGILGVHSVSEEAPLKIAGFKLRDAGFEGKQKYSDWQFVYTPPAQAAPAKPAAKPGAQPAQQVAPQALTGPGPATRPTP